MQRRGLEVRQVNRHLVAALGNGVGLTGADGGTFQAEKHQPQDQDLGYVGRITRVNPRLVNLLLEEGMVLNVDMPFTEIGWGSVHTEDTVCITSDSYEALTSTDFDIIEV